LKPEHKSIPPTCHSTTANAHVQETAALGRPLFSLFSHPAPRVAHAAALVMRAVAEGGAEAAQPMREAALTGGWLAAALWCWWCWG
jgi:DnaJ family protein C protein 13